MATPMIMPRQGQSVESCIIAGWHKKKGQRVEVGDLLFSYETDKASFDEEAKVSGVLLEVFFEAGDDVPCLTNVGVIGNEGESTAEFNPHLSLGQSNKPETSNQPTPAISQNRIESEIPAIIHPAHDDIIKISPRARNLAAKVGVDFRYANPTGPDGRIIEEDILTLKDAGMVFTASAGNEHRKAEVNQSITGTGLGGRITTADLQINRSKAGYNVVGSTAVKESTEPLYEEVKLPNIRKVIAKTMQYSLSSSAQLTLNNSFDATDILDFRKKLKDSKEQLELENITINDIIVYAVSRTLPGHKELNAHCMEDRIFYFKNVNIGVAVDTERGLMVPTLLNVNHKTLNDISHEIKQLVKECQSGTINPDLLKNGSFTVTNLGTLGIESFTPVINPPQTGILGINTIIQRAKEVDGEYLFYPAMGLSLTFDHRALDGAPAARFLQDLKQYLENFSVLLAR